MIKFLFPRTNELTVFVIALVLYVTVLFVPDIINTVIEFSRLAWNSWLSVLSKSGNIYETTKYVLGFTGVVIVLLFYFIGPLLLPFTKKDLRVSALLILWVDAALLIYWNIHSMDTAQWYRGLSSLYVISWLLYSLLVVKLDKVNGIKKLVNEEQTTPSVAIRTALLGAIMSLTLIYLLDWKWLDAYMLAVFTTLLTEKVLSESVAA